MSHASRSSRRDVIEPLLKEWIEGGFTPEALDALYRAGFPLLVALYKWLGSTEPEDRAMEAIVKLWQNGELLQTDRKP